MRNPGRSSRGIGWAITAAACLMPLMPAMATVRGGSGGGAGRDPVPDVLQNVRPDGQRISQAAITALDPQQENSITLLSVKCLKPASGIDATTIAIFQAIGAAANVYRNYAGGGGLASQAKSLAKDALLVSGQHAVGLGDGSLTDALIDQTPIGAIKEGAAYGRKFIQTLDSVFSDVDDLYITMSVPRRIQKRVWGGSKGSDVRAGQQVTLPQGGMKAPLTADGAVISLFDWDWPSADDKIAELRIPANHAFGEYTYVTGVQSEGALYEIRIRVEPSGAYLASLRAQAIDQKNQADYQAKLKAYNQSLQHYNANLQQAMNDEARWHANKDREELEYNQYGQFCNNPAAAAAGLSPEVISYCQRKYGPQQALLQQQPGFSAAPQPQPSHPSGPRLMATAQGQGQLGAQSSPLNLRAFGSEDGGWQAIELQDPTTNETTRIVVTRIINDANLQGRIQTPQYTADCSMMFLEALNQLMGTCRNLANPGTPPLQLKFWNVREL